MAQFVRDVMTPDVAAVLPDASLVEAAQLMRAQDIGDVLVTQDGVLLGVVTDRDITLRAVADGVDPLAVSCRSVCTPEPVCVGPDDHISEAVTLMRTNAVRRLPVVENGTPVGVVSIGDLARAQEPDSALADISRAAPDSWPDVGNGGPGIV
ncbi:oxidoreductase [Streptomyces chrestomyceticus JCM 4735]|uniref:Oxidoreductase n=1 Tax=Streptomyces chrestomyceticus JCM 4735 TaxID=1306181 RepID=A0A7U9KRZ1_9ACTN|nr:CBS domain-containing protein [Streptomyces chrestomyceticus]GCD33703.1 oxidoreductase [Streptomyces chrestomyceticus JCM 4735]